ncbi:MFS transporter, partial [candidate division KSB1 bacterium]|nr:MFS transporter [candidate division KSB1 bacterium]
MPARTYRQIITAWCFYDWADSAFATTIMAAMFPPYYRTVAMAAGAASHQATAMWGYTTAIALLITAISAPILGAISDDRGTKKLLMALFSGLGIFSTAMFVFIGKTEWLFASILFIGGDIGFAGSITFYESLLPHIARRNDIDQISTAGYALGYVGGGILLVINVLWFMQPQWFGMPDQNFALKASFFSVAVWWLIFSLPLYRYVPEPPFDSARQRPQNLFRIGFSRLAQTFSQLRKYKQLLIFLIAFWIYNDGIGTIIKMATA